MGDALDVVVVFQGVEEGSLTNQDLDEQARTLDRVLGPARR